METFLTRSADNTRTPDYTDYADLSDTFTLVRVGFEAAFSLAVH